MFVFAGQMMMWAGCGDSEVCMLALCMPGKCVCVCVDEMLVWIGTRHD